MVGHPAGMGQLLVVWGKPPFIGTGCRTPQKGTIQQHGIPSNKTQRQKQTERGR